MVERITSTAAARQQQQIFAADLERMLVSKLSNGLKPLPLSLRNLKPITNASVRLKPVATLSAHPLKPSTGLAHAVNPKLDIKELPPTYAAILEILKDDDVAAVKEVIAGLLDAGLSKKECAELLKLARQCNRLEKMATGKLPLDSQNNFVTAVNTPNPPVDLTDDERDNLLERNLPVTTANKETADLALTEEFREFQADLGAAENGDENMVGVVTNRDQYTKKLMRRAKADNGDPNTNFNLDEGEIVHFDPREISHGRKPMPKLDAGQAEVVQVTAVVDLHHTSAPVENLATTQKPPMSLEQQVALGLAPSWMLPPRPTGHDKG